MTKKKKSKFYVVWNGRSEGIYDNWEDCLKQVSGFKEAKYKSFKTLEEAREAFKSKSSKYIGKSDYESASLTTQQKERFGLPLLNSICVDAACSNNPGILEYRGVETESKKEIFRKGPYMDGTVNIGEFLAIVDGIRFLRRKKQNIPIYSDSKVAIKWVKSKKVNTLLKKKDNNKQLFVLIKKALKYLNQTDYQNQIIKWPTEAWGEIPADFGRK